MLESEEKQETIMNVVWVRIWKKSGQCEGINPDIRLDSSLIPRLFNNAVSSSEVI
jgi:hypothetical protein